MCVCVCVCEREKEPLPWAFGWSRRGELLLDRAAVCVESEKKVISAERGHFSQKSRESTQSTLVLGGVAIAAGVRLVESGRVRSRECVRVSVRERETSVD